MAYFVTGATGFIGRHLVQELLDNRDGEIFVLVRKGSQGRLDHLLRSWGTPSRVTAVTGDLTKPNLGVSKAWAREHRGSDRALLPRRGALRHDRLRRAQRAAQRRWHARGPRPGRRARHRHVPPGLVDRGVRRLPRHVRRDDVRRGPGPALGVPPDEVRVRADRARGVDGAVAGLPSRRRGRATPRPARWTRSTGPTTSSRCSSGCATTCPGGCRSSASTSATPTWCRSTTSPRRWTTSRTSPVSTGRPSTWSTRSPSRRSTWSTSSPTAAKAPRFAVPLDRRVTGVLPTTLLPRALRPAGLVQNAAAHLARPAGAARDHRPPRHPARGARAHLLPHGVRLPPHRARALAGPASPAPTWRGTPRRCGPTGRSTSTPTPPRTAGSSRSSRTAAW